MKSEQTESEVSKTKTELSTTASITSADETHESKLVIAADTAADEVTVREVDNTIDTKLTEVFGGFAKTFVFTSRVKFYDLDIYIALIRPTILRTLNEEVINHGGVKAFITLYPIYKEFKPNGVRMTGSLAAKAIIATNKFEILAGVDHAFRRLRNLHDEFNPGMSCLCMDRITTAKLDTVQFNPRG